MDSRRTSPDNRADGIIFHLGEKVVIADPDDERFGQIGYVIDKGKKEENVCWVRFERAEVRKYEKTHVKRYDP